MVSDLNTFAYKGCKIAALKKLVFSSNFALLACFFLVLVLLSALVERCFVSRMWNFLLIFYVLDDFSRLKKKMGFLVFLIHPTVVSVLLSALVERCFVSRMWDFFVNIYRTICL